MKQIFIAMRNSKGEQLQEKFRVLPGVHCNISFRSSGSQESNASNGVQFRAKMKKLWPFEDNCTKLEGHFASLQNWGKWISQALRNQSWGKSISRLWEIFASIAKSSCVIFRYFCTDKFLSPDILCNYLFSPCNQLKIFSRYLGYLKWG